MNKVILLKTEYVYSVLFTDLNGTKHPFQFKRKTNDLKELKQEKMYNLLTLTLRKIVYKNSQVHLYKDNGYVFASIVLKPRADKKVNDLISSYLVEGSVFEAKYNLKAHRDLMKILFPSRKN